eukprot:TRINITY_DN1777_c0_g1_i1.p1 TRINITY_DN1777_c0_g1~~TRINITY_DN1777_c0_g1_i1.p1  ORF type:complete len:354 (-),score=48.40 TRINITY_DN1777_c0_g1_i1:82-1143(-)
MSSSSTTTSSSRPLRIDFHTHILPKNWPDLKEKYGYSGFVQLDHHCHGKARMMLDGKCFREIESNCWDTETRIKECDEKNVDVQVISTVPVMFCYWAKPEDTLDLAQYLNDHIAQVVSENPTRYIGLGTLPMQAPDLAIQELRRCVEDLGLKGVQIGTHVNGMNFDHPSLFPIFQEAERLGAVVFVHPWDMLGKERMPKYWLPWLIGMPTETAIAISTMIFGGVFERLPNLKVCFAHGGGSFPQLIGRLDHGFHARPDLCATDNVKPPREYVGKFWVDSLVHDKSLFKSLVELVGIDKVVIGSDYPFPLGEDSAGKIVDESDLTNDEKEMILSGNAIKLLGIDKDLLERGKQV